MLTPQIKQRVINVSIALGISFIVLLVFHLGLKLGINIGLKRAAFQQQWDEIALQNAKDGGP